MKETGIIMSGSHPKDILEGRKTMTRRTWGLEAINKDPDDWELLPSDSAYPQFGKKSTLDIKLIKCPYGQVGDRLWVRETFAVRTDGIDQILYKADYEAVVKLLDLPEFNIKWKPSIHMFKKDSRITREIIEIKAERLQKITEEDAIAEGVNGYLVKKFSYGSNYRVFRAYHKECYPLVDHADIGDIVRFQGPNMGFACFQSRNPKCKTGTLNIDAEESFNYVGSIEPDYRNGFQILWDSLNGKRKKDLTTNLETIYPYSWRANPWVFAMSFKEVE